PPPALPPFPTRRSSDLRTAHTRGPDSEECSRAIAGADAAIGRLVDQLRALERWDRSVLIVTADHGFTGLVPSRERPYPVITFGRSEEHTSELQSRFDLV